MAESYLRVEDMAVTILTAVSSFFTSAGVALPSRQLVLAGAPIQIAWDCEQLTVTLDGIGWGPMVDLSVPSPQIAGMFSAQSVRHAVFVVQLVRCTPVVQGDARSSMTPSDADLMATGRQYMRDAGVLSQALVMACRDIVSVFGHGLDVQAGALGSDGPEGAFHALTAQIGVTMADVT